MFSQNQNLGFTSVNRALSSPRARGPVAPGPQRGEDGTAERS